MFGFVGFENERGGDGKDWLGVKFSLLEFFIDNFIGVDGWMGMMGGGLGFDTFLSVNRGWVLVGEGFYLVIFHDIVIPKILVEIGRF